MRTLEEQNLEDRLRIQRLVSLSQPVGHDITFTMRRDEGQLPEVEAWEDDRRDWVEKALATEKDVKVLELLRSIKRLGQVSKGGWTGPGPGWVWKREEEGMGGGAEDGGRGL